MHVIFPSLFILNFTVSQGAARKFSRHIRHAETLNSHSPLQKHQCILKITYFFQNLAMAQWSKVAIFCLIGVLKFLQLEISEALTKELNINS